MKRWRDTEGLYMNRFMIILSTILILTSCDSTLYYPEHEQKETSTDNFTYEASDDYWLDQQTNFSMASGLVGSKDFLYFSIGTTPARYNITSGKITYLCPDPLCFHNTSDCPFYGINPSEGFRGIISENTIFYPVSYSEAEGKFSNINRLMKYDIASAEIDTVINDFSNGGIVDYKVGGNYFYCYHQIADDGNSIRYYISQFNIKNGKFEKEWLIAAIDGFKCYNLVYADEAYLYLSLYESGCLYAVPHEDQTKIKLLYEIPDGYCISQTVFHNGEFLILEASPENSSARLVRYRMDNNTAEIITEFPDIPAYNMYFTENYVYYTYDHKKELGKINGTNEILKLHDSVIYRISHTAESPIEEQVFAFPSEMEAYALQSFAVCGNYLYGYYIAWESAKEGYQNGYNSKDANCIMRINLQNGEIDYINE